MHRVTQVWLVSFAVTALLASPGAGAADCKYQTDSTDKFTKIRTLRTNWDSLMSWTTGFGSEDYSDTYVSALSKGKGESINRYLSVKISAYKYSKYRPRDYELENLIVVQEDARLLVMMEEQTIVELQASRGETARSSYQAPGSDGGEYSITTVIAIGYTLDESTANLLMAQNATHIRVETAEGNHNVEIHKKSLGDIKKAVKCILDPP